MKYLFVLVITLLGCNLICAQDFGEEHARLVDMNEEFQQLALPVIETANAQLLSHHDEEFSNVDQTVYAFQRQLTNTYYDERDIFLGIWNSITEDISDCTQVTVNDMGDIYIQTWGTASETLYNYKETLATLLETSTNTIELDYQTKLMEVSDLLNSDEATAEQLAEFNATFRDYIDSFEGRTIAGVGVVGGHMADVTLSAQTAADNYITTAAQDFAAVTQELQACVV